MREEVKSKKVEEEAGEMEEEWKRRRRGIGSV